MARAKRIEVVRTDKICWPMFESGKSRKEVAEETGISLSAVSRSDTRRLGKRESGEGGIDDLRQGIKDADADIDALALRVRMTESRLAALEEAVAPSRALAESRVRAVLTPEWEARLRELVAERDLYKEGYEEMVRKAERLDSRIVNRGLLSDEEHENLKREIEENERSADQNLDGTLPEKAGQE